MHAYIQTYICNPPTPVLPRVKRLWKQIKCANPSPTPPRWENQNPCLPGITRSKGGDPPLPREVMMIMTRMARQELNTLANAPKVLLNAAPRGRQKTTWGPRVRN